MSDVLEFLLDRWPLLGLGAAILAVNFLVVRAMMAEYRAMLDEYKKSSEHLRSEVTFLRVETSNYRSEIDLLKEEQSRLIGQIADFNAQLQSISSAWSDMTKDAGFNLSEIASRQNALFSDVKNLSDDLQLAWKAILRFVSKGAGTEEEKLIELRGRLSDQ